MKFLGLILGILAMFVVFFLFVFIGRIVEPLLNLLTQTGKNILLVVAGIAFLIGINIIAYRESYVTGRRKWWYFWLCLGLTITFVIMILFPTLFI